MFGRLVEAIQDPLVLASELYSKGIIPEAVVSKVLPGTGLTDCEKNAIVLRAVSSRLRTFPSDFEQLLDVLEKSSALSRDHAVQLRQAYGKGFTCEDIGAIVLLSLSTFRCHSAVSKVNEKTI